MARRSRRTRLALVGALLLASAFLAGTFLPLLAPAYAPLCHQIAERSLTVGGAHQSVCARCCGLYVGGVAGIAVAALVLGRVRRVPPAWLVVTAAPTVMDVVSPWLGGPGLPAWPRLLLAVAPGLVAGILVGLAIAEIAERPAWRSAEAARV